MSAAAGWPKCGRGGSSKTPRAARCSSTNGPPAAAGRRRPLRGALAATRDRMLVARPAGRRSASARGRLGQGRPASMRREQACRSFADPRRRWTHLRHRSPASMPRRRPGAGREDRRQRRRQARARWALAEGRSPRGTRETRARLIIRRRREDRGHCRAKALRSDAKRARARARWRLGWSRRRSGHGSQNMAILAGSWVAWVAVMTDNSREDD